MKEPQRQSWYNKVRQKFLLSFFDNENRVEKKDVNGFVLIKRFSSGRLDWEVAIYTKDSFEKHQVHKERIKKLIDPRGNNQERG